MQIKENGRIDCLTEKTKAWAKKHGINTLSCKIELLKITEEVGELAAATTRSNRAAMIDAVGDVYIALVNYAESAGLDIADCIESALSEVEKRDGRIIHGAFVKSEDLKGED